MPDSPSPRPTGAFRALLGRARAGIDRVNSHPRVTPARAALVGAIAMVAVGAPLAAQAGDNATSAAVAQALAAQPTPTVTVTRVTPGPTVTATTTVEVTVTATSIVTETVEVVAEPVPLMGDHSDDGSSYSSSSGDSSYSSNDSSTSGGGGAYFSNCTEAREAGAAPIHRGEPGYRSALDRDNDGIACE